MKMLILLRLIIVICTITILDLILKLNKTIKIEKRLSKYTIPTTNDLNNNLENKLKNKYNHFLIKSRKTLKNNKTLNNHSQKYYKYITSPHQELIDFIIIKLSLGLIITIIIIVSKTLKGTLATFPELLISFIIGYYIYDIYLHISKKHRQEKIKSDILRAVIIMNNAFKAGRSTLQAVEMTYQELSGPISKEFKKIYQDLSFGLSSEVAFQRFAKRVEIEEANYISSSLTILSKTGGNIINVFSSIEKALYDKKKLETDLKNRIAPSNFIIKTLMFIPLIFILIIYILNPTYFDPLFKTTLGLFIILVIILMFSLYLYLLNKIMKVKV